jgi:superfamily II DNA or RNA helicase
MVKGLKWDLLVIDEAHEGVDTFKTDVAFNNITRNFTLHLSGTPLKRLRADASGIADFQLDLCRRAGR